MIETGKLSQESHEIASADVRQVAAEYAAAGCWPVVLAPRQKRPIRDDWNDLRIRPEDVPAHFRPDNNVGLILGDVSGGLVDFDLDCPEAVALAGAFLGKTTHAAFGRGGAVTHYLIRAKGVKTRGFDDPTAAAGKSKLIEIRAGETAGHQTMAPPSVHPDTDETLEWMNGGVADLGDPIPADAAERLVRIIAAACLIVRHWPGAGMRHETSMAMCGAIARAIENGGAMQSDADAVAFWGVVIDYLAASGREDPKDAKGRKRHMAEAIERLADDRETWGIPKLKELGAFPAPVLDRIADWLGLGRAAGAVITPGAPFWTAGTWIAEEWLHDDMPTLRRWRDEWWRWCGPVWERIPEADMRARAWRWLATCWAEVEKSEGVWVLVRVKPFTKMVNGLLDALAARPEVALAAALEPPCRIEDGKALRDLLAVRNGLLHLPTRTLRPHTPEVFNVTAIDAAWHPEAQAAGWQGFLRSIFTDDQPGQIALLQEVFGYLLTPDTSRQKGFMLIGPPRSGKGTIGRVLARLHGANLVTPRAGQLGQQFGMASLIGKAVAVMADVRIDRHTGHAAVAETLLSVIGEDRQTVPRKFLPDWTGHLAARFLVMSNSPPAFRDGDAVLATRFLYLQTGQSFLGREDYKLDHRLDGEADGILRWAVDGWARLAEAGRFTETATSKALLARQSAIQSPVAAFVDEYCDLGPDLWEMSSTLFDAFAQFCDDHAVGLFEAASFARQLQAAQPQLRTSRLAGGTRPRIKRGIMLNAAGIELARLYAGPGTGEDDAMRCADRTTTEKG